MPAGFTIHRLDGRGGLLRSLIQLIGCLRALKPALAVSLLVRANLCTAIAARLAGCPSVLCERMHLSAHLDGRYQGWRRTVAKALPRLIYPLATRNLGVSAGVTRDLIERFGIAPARTATLPNAYDLDALAAAAAEPCPIPLPEDFLVAVGRLVPSKNFAGLIEAYLRSGVSAALVILGEGPERAALERQVAEAGAGGHIHLPGYLANPHPVTARAQAYVSASRNEGFPNAMVEAMALGVPVVASDCRSGPAEILAGVERLGDDDLVRAEYGLITPDGALEPLAAALRLIADPQVRTHYAQQSRRRAQDYRADCVADLHWSLFEQLMRRRTHSANIRNSP